MTYAYDIANRLTAETWLNASGSVVNTQTFTLDNNGNLTSAADATGTYTLAYDPLNRLTSQTDLRGLSLTYAYDAANRRTSVQDSLGGLLTSVYDNGNRLTSRQLSGSGQQARMDLGYNGRNDLTSLTRYSDTAGTTVVGSTSYGLDDAGRLTAITHKNGSAATLSYYNAAYDNANRITTETWASGSTTGTHAYAYDSANQLTSDGSTNYAYDFQGNRTMSGYQTGPGNQVTTDGTWTYTYDPEGNLIQKSKGSGLETWYYTYDNLNRLTLVRQTSNGTTDLLRAAYTYDVFGNRVEEDKWKSGPGTTSVLRHAYDDAGNQWVDRDGSGTVLARYLYGDGVDQIWARLVPAGQTNAGVAWYLTDRMGSVRDLMDNSGTIRDHLDYDGFGKATETNSAFGDSRKWTGREFDSDTGLQYNHGRWYDPATGRWISMDPLGFGAGDANLYRYVGNASTNAIDPSGEFWWFLVGAAAAVLLEPTVVNAPTMDDVVAGRLHGSDTMGATLKGALKGASIPLAAEYPVVRTAVGYGALYGSAKQSAQSIYDYRTGRRVRGLDLMDLADTSLMAGQFGLPLRAAPGLALPFLGQGAQTAWEEARQGHYEEAAIDFCGTWAGMKALGPPLSRDLGLLCNGLAYNCQAVPRTLRGPTISIGRWLRGPSTRVPASGQPEAEGLPGGVPIEEAPARRNFGQFSLIPTAHGAFLLSTAVGGGGER